MAAHVDAFPRIIIDLLLLTLIHACHGVEMCYVRSVEMAVHDSVVKGGGNTLSRRLHKILETRLENDKETLEAVKELSTFFTENTLQARRNLRSKIEKRSLAINEVVCMYNHNLLY